MACGKIEILFLDMFFTHHCREETLSFHHVLPDLKNIYKQKSYNAFSVHGDMWWDAKINNTSFHNQNQVSQTEQLRLTYHLPMVRSPRLLGVESANFMSLFRVIVSRFVSRDWPRDLSRDIIT